MESTAYREAWMYTGWYTYCIAMIPAVSTELFSQILFQTCPGKEQILKKAKKCWASAFFFEDTIGSCQRYECTNKKA